MKFKIETLLEEIQYMKELHCYHEDSEGSDAMYVINKIESRLLKIINEDNKLENYIKSLEIKKRNLQNEKIELVKKGADKPCSSTSLDGLEREIEKTSSGIEQLQHTINDLKKLL